VIKTPISYYGGKQNLIRHLLPLIPPHRQYVEPFFGGGALFFAKSPSENEVINDSDNNVINFYEVLQNDFPALEKRIKSTLHSEYSHKQAGEILKNGAGKVDKAWAFWVQTNLSFSNKINMGFAFGNDCRCAQLTRNKRDGFTDIYKQRLESAEIFCRDALAIIKLKDTIDTFFYCDPPYPNSDCGHYKGYTESNLKNLLESLSQIKGKFLLSSYPIPILSEYAKKYNWIQESIEQPIAVTSKRTGKIKTECLTRNYELISLFNNEL